jgi:lysophospholipase L1-like esterase
VFPEKVLLLWVLSVVGVVASDRSQPADPDPKRFAQEIKAFAEWDSKNAIPAQPVLFVGSSSIRLWRTHESFPELPVVNRGFGGSQISDVIHFFDQVVAPYRARVIVFYAGSNDIASGKSAERVCDDFRRFVKLVHAGQPQTRIIFLGINPSQSRWKFQPEVKKANGLVAEFCRSDSRLVFADFGALFLGADGLPDSSLYLKDQLHLNDKGYAVWNKALAPVLQKVLAAVPAQVP